MKKTINVYDFRDAFLNSDSRKEQFSYEGLTALFEYLESCEDKENELEFDMIAICCDYCEYESALECAKEYGFELDEDTEAEAIDWLEDRTIVIEFNGGIVIQNF